MSKSYREKGASQEVNDMYRHLSILCEKRLVQIMNNSKRIILVNAMK